MKKYLVIIGLMIVMGVSTVSAESYDDFNRRLGNSDWATPVHFGLGAVAGGLTTYYLPKDIHPGLRWTAGVLAGTLAGCVSESLDKNWDNGDLIQWVGGGFIGATLVSIPIIKGTF
ncbi:hypothetical protein M0R04_04600 [Candidatus Dojkabacteria bacterium]|jgi:hypothetical protein|nr:hypothetical protein [Candidatus Dojkabacteria bacterium]